MVGTLFPRESNDNCIESVETPKTVVLQMDLERQRSNKGPITTTKLALRTLTSPHHHAKQFARLKKFVIYQGKSRIKPITYQKDVNGNSNSTKDRNRKNEPKQFSRYLVQGDLTRKTD